MVSNYVVDQTIQTFCDGLDNLEDNLNTAGAVYRVLLVQRGCAQPHVISKWSQEKPDIENLKLQDRQGYIVIQTAKVQISLEFVDSVKVLIKEIAHGRTRY